MAPFLAMSLSVGVMAVAWVSADDGNWPQFRGELGTAVAKDHARPPTNFNQHENVVWSAKVPPGHSSPCVQGRRVFVTGFDADTMELRILAIDRDDGRVVWQRARQVSKVEKVHRVSSPATATPVADAQRVYVYFGSCGLICYDLTGNELWTLDMPIPKVWFGAVLFSTVNALGAECTIVGVDSELEVSFEHCIPGRTTDVRSFR